MPTIEEVFEHLVESLCPNFETVEDHKYIYLFLQGLENSKKLKDDIDCNSVRLLICMAIDVKTYKKEFGNSRGYYDLIGLYQRLILFTRPPYKVKSMNDVENKGVLIPNHVKFAYALNQNHYLTCKPSIKVDKKEDFVRIYNFEGFLKNVAYVNKDLNPGSVPPDLDFALIEKDIILYYSTFQSGVFFTDISVSELGNPRRGWVFVAERKDLDNDPACMELKGILDSLGFYTTEVNEKSFYISLNYPRDFEETSFQPISATGDWGSINDDHKIVTGNEFFMSYFKEDEWGRTYSITGNMIPKLERVHLYFNHRGTKIYEFTINDLGQLTSLIVKDSTNRIVSEALHRFANA